MKLDPGIAILTGSFLVALFSGMNLSLILRTFLSAIIDPTTLRLIGIVFLVMLLGELLSKSGSLENILYSLENLVKDKRITLVLPPSLLGLLPMPGGALLSAPLVERAARGMNLTPEKKTFLNHWFRHICEYVWPLNPGIIIASAVLGVPVFRIIGVLFPLTLAATICGIFFGLRKISQPSIVGHPTQNKRKAVKLLLKSIWPIPAIILLAIGLKIEILYALLGIVIIIFLSSPVRHSWATLIRKSLSWNIVLLLIAVMIFRHTLQASPLFPRIPELFGSLCSSPLFLLFSLPFLIGLLVGFAPTFVGVTFPIFLPYLLSGSNDLTLIMLAYAGGFAGVMLSPVHLCLILTKNYFRANLSRTYQLLLGPSILVALTGVAIVLLKQ